MPLFPTPPLFPKDGDRHEKHRDRESKSLPGIHI